MPSLMWCCAIPSLIRVKIQDKNCSQLNQILIPNEIIISLDNKINCRVMIKSIGKGRKNILSGQKALPKISYSSGHPSDHDSIHICCVSFLYTYLLRSFVAGCPPAQPPLDNDQCTYTFY